MLDAGGASLHLHSAMRRLNSNTPRGTPGLILLLFATVLLASSLVRFSQSHQAPVPDEAEPLTGLGDSHYYTTLSDNDFYQPALVFEKAPKGLFRRTVNPVARPDSRMLRHGVESTGQFIVYGETAPKKQVAPRWFLKAGPGHYVEFGARKYWPEYKNKAKP